MAKKANQFNAPLTPSPALAEVVGSKKLSRPAAVKAVWAYVKSKKLQDKKDKRTINADAKLSKLFGGKKSVSMFQLAALISKNLK